MKRSSPIRRSPDAVRLGPFVEEPAGFIVTRLQGATFCGRTVPAGAPVPAGAVTPFLESIGWIRGVEAEEYRAAVKAFGRPPAGALKVGWRYRHDATKTSKKASRRTA